MMVKINRYLLLLISPLLLLACSQQADYASDPAQAEQHQSLKDVEYLSSDALGGRETGTQGNRMAREYIENRFDSLGLKMFGASYRQPFSQAVSTGEADTDTVTAINLVGYVEGSVNSERFIVITAHYDHLKTRQESIYNGADDNASGTAGLMAAAAYFTENSPENSIIFIGFDAEEKGLAGARYFTENPLVPLDQVVININMDMISTNFENELYAVGTYHYPFLKPFIEEYTNDAPVNVLFGYDSDEWDQNWTLASDHGPFHQKDVPFIYFGVEDHEHYHAPSDTYENINPEFYLGAVETIIGVIEGLDRDLNEIAEQSGRF
ncbi:M28 family peptidase [Rhodohalobacter sp. 8-1]|uniref:M28 family peptidase n=1 Tax=Rhodohalobacter sp. 8-1 TaxID=3131972 RepID=UPI0030EC890E